MKSTTRFLCVFAVIMSVLFAGCSSASDTINDAPMGTSVPMPANAMPEFDYSSAAGMDGGEMQEEMYGDSSNESYGSINASSSQTRKLIKTANLSVETQEFDESVTMIEDLCSQYGGYIENSNVYGSKLRDFDAYGNYFGNSRTASYSLRIPQGSYDEFLNDAASIGIITSKSQNTQDITQEYYDTDSRLKAIEMRRDRLFDLIAEAQDAQSIVILEESLSQAIYEIELYASQLRGYDNQTEFSSISIELFEVVEFSPTVTPDPITYGERVSTAFGDAVSGFVEGIQNISVWFVRSIFGIIIFAVIAAAAVIITGKVLRKREPEKNPPPKDVQVSDDSDKTK